MAHIHFCPPTTSVKTIEVSDRMNVDLAPDDKIYGAERIATDCLFGIIKN